MKRQSLRRVCTLLMAVLLVVLAGCTSIPKVKLNDEQKHLIAYGAIMEGVLEMKSTDLAGFYGASRGEVEELMLSLGIASREGALHWLDELCDGPNYAQPIERGVKITGDELLHVLQGKLLTVGELDPEDVETMREYYRDQCDIIVSRTDISQAALDNVDTLAAFDCELLVFYARVLFGLEYIDEDEAWQYIGFAADLAREKYDSWEEYAAACMVGYAIGGADLSEVSPIVRALLRDEESPYQIYSFGG